MDENENQEPEPKISLPEVILIGLVFLIIDLVEIVIVFAGLDDFWILDLIASSIFIYLFIKGVPPMRQLVAWLIELIPWVGALPLLTIGWGLTVWADHHPSGVAAKAGAVAGAAKGARAAPKVRGVGARSLAQMERAEERAGKVLGREVRPAWLEEAAAGAAGEEIGKAAPPEAPPPEIPPPKKQGEIPETALGAPPTEFEKLEKLTKEPPLEEEKKNEGGELPKAA